MESRYIEIDGEAMAYSRIVYSSIIIIGVILYIMGLYMLFAMVRDFNNQFIPMINSLSSARISYRPRNITISKVGGRVILKALIELNITWTKKSPAKGPTIDLLLMNKSLAHIVFTNMSKDLINYPVSIEVPLTKDTINEEITMLIHVNTNLVSFTQTTRLTNITTFGNYIDLYIRDIRINRVGNTSRIYCIIYSNIAIDAPVRITMVSRDGMELYSKVLMNYSSSPSKPYICELTVDNSIIQNTEYIVFDINGLQIEKYNLGKQG